MTKETDVEAVARALARCDNINTNNDATYAASSYGIRARAAIAAMPAASEQEPVAWKVERKDLNGEPEDFFTDMPSQTKIGKVTPLYTHPSPTDRDKLVAELEIALRIEAWNLGIARGKSQDEALAYVEGRIARARQIGGGA